MINHSTNIRHFVNHGSSPSTFL
uniref:Uncharacterized protein n=1 Tax=Anopheles funestus TaxID=62324 RepID=A0A182S2S1_ANOFN